MATMNFSIPDDIKERFNQAFADVNKSAIVAKLMEEAIEQAERKRRSLAAVRRVLKRRQTAPTVSSEEIVRLRDKLRAESNLGHTPKTR